MYQQVAFVVRFMVDPYITQAYLFNACHIQQTLKLFYRRLDSAVPSKHQWPEPKLTACKINLTFVYVTDIKNNVLR
jgi:hypothetical protein